MRSLPMLTIAAMFSAAIALTTPSLAREAPTERAMRAAPVPLGSIEHFIYVPLVRQATNYTCGVAATQSVLGYYGEDNREDALYAGLKPDPENGTASANIAAFAKSRGYSVDLRTGLSIADLEAAVDAKQPVIVLIQAWTEDPATIDWENDWSDGHYVVVIGYDDINLYFMDPSTLGNYTYIPKDEFLRRWHDTDGTTRVVHFGLTIAKPAPGFDFQNVLKID